MNLRKLISENRLAVFGRLLPSMWREYWRFADANARCKNSRMSEKRLTDILMTTHALEKALSLPNLRKSFGLKKAQGLIKNIQYYIDNYGFSDQLIVPISILKIYINYHKNNNVWSGDLKKIEENLIKIIEESGRSIESYNMAGSFVRTREDLEKTAHSDFKEMALNRFSIRNFSNEEISETLIDEAISIAKKSPSACNRQSYRVHVYKGENKNRILEIQGGANGFYKNANTLFIITADLNRYYLKEIHLGFVDASLFAMSLIYSLTYLGIGSIPLTLGIGSSKLDEIQRGFGIPQNEIPVILIAAGHYADNLNVAMSTRNSNETFVTKH